MPARLRLAIRTEGTQVTAYLAPAEGWHNVELIGSIKTEALKAEPALAEDFKTLMKQTAEVLIAKRGAELETTS